MNEYLNQIEISGITYDLVASGGTGGSGVTSGQVETMIRNYTYDKFTIDRKIDNAFDPEQYYTKADIDTKESDLNERIDELSGKTITVSGKVSTLEDDLENAYQEIKNVRLELSGAIDTKQDILVAGDNIIITGNVISAVMSGGSGVTSGQVQMMIDQSISGISGNTNVISGDVKTLSGDVKIISGDVVTISGDVKGLETKIDALSGALDDKQDKLVSGVNIKTINNQSLLGSGNITISGGSGSTYTAGRGIDISNTNVISFNLPISAGTGTNSVTEGAHTVANGYNSHAEGFNSRAESSYSHAEGGSISRGMYSHAEGVSNTTNDYEHASGKLNTSVKISDNFGDSGNTLFSVGNGYIDTSTSVITRHNTLDIRQDGSIYIPDIKANGGYYEKPMMLLQEAFLQSGDVITVVDKYAYDNKLAVLDGSDVYFNWNTKALGYSLRGVGHSQGSDMVLTFGSGFTRDTTTVPNTLAVDMNYINANISGGSGVTSGEVQTMINQSISGKVDDITTSFAKWEEGSGFTVNVIKNGQTTKRDLFAPHFGLKYRKSISHDTPYLEVDMDYINSHISGGTSGITYSAGTGIDITDRVISSTLNAYNGTGSGTLLIGDTRNTASTDFAVAIGVHNEALGVRSFAQGISGKTTNIGESTFGQLNDTKHEYVGFGNSGNTLFTIGNGAGVDGSTTNYARHNAFEVRSNGDIYIPEPSKVTPNHYYQAPMIKLQDRLAQIDNKPNIWCGTEAQWSKISGSTQSGTLYLIY